jgi:ABC-2 type transport system permease protein
VGGRALSGEETRNTMGLLLANPISRYRIVIEKSIAMIVCSTVTGTATFAGVAAGNLLGGLGMSYTNLAATCLMVTLLGILFGALAIAIDSAIGNGRTAASGSIGAALASYLVSSFLPLNQNLAGLAKWSPYYYFQGNDPIHNGLDLTHIAVLAGSSLVLLAISIFFFQRRDLRYSA